MNEADLWSHLEFRVTREFEFDDKYNGMGLWCDGFVPCSYDFEAERACAEGDAWICFGQEQQKWRFRLVLKGDPKSREGIDWAVQLPWESAFEWMVLDFEQRVVEIDPAAAVPDPNGPANGRPGDSRIVQIHGWDFGLEKTPLSKFLIECTSLKLDEAERLVDVVLSGEAVNVEIHAGENPVVIAAKLREMGARASVVQGLSNGQ